MPQLELIHLVKCTQIALDAESNELSLRIAAAAAASPAAAAAAAAAASTAISTIDSLQDPAEFVAADSPIVSVGAVEVNEIRPSQKSSQFVRRLREELA